ncbi:hypothetical protein EYF80_056107 [Liparis tanakae]|uniref:Uncharacterized protein n=1 Tax=Liparis tanakae TaxID=230148 RepID=A0A4Z2EZQ1_9TELE|nr:hypothetical protein EYF80_056107 [Liparis tanakae]
MSPDSEALRGSGAELVFIGGGEVNTCVEIVVLPDLILSFWLFPPPIMHRRYWKSQSPAPTNLPHQM